MRKIRVYNQSRISHLALTTMIVCICHRISDRDIARQVQMGQSFDDMQLHLGVATQCGQCEGCARDVMARCRSAQVTQSIPVQLANRISESTAWHTYSPLSAA